MNGLKEYLLNSNIISFNKKQIRVCYTKIENNIIEEIIQLTSNCRDNISERIYWILNDIFDYPKCTNCR